ncbi:MAG: antitoxin [Actinomycetota bacterium]|jgi:hypothetical protein|nr:antitoxin [Actinomycetota bacterium]MDQ3528334.1 antitoxin [Actinomycetota bacterium]
MATMTRRLQLLLDEGRYTRLERRAKRRGTSVAAVIREAIDTTFPDEDLDRERAVQFLLDAEPMPIDDWPVLKREIDELLEPNPRR